MTHVQVESYEGILLLTTNFEKGIDDAFKRRIKMRITFPFPEADERLRLWEAMIPTEVERDASIDLREMAKTFRITGGNIKSAVLRAAFLAADLGTALDQACLRRGAELEWLELGNLPIDARVPEIPEDLTPRPLEIDPLEEPIGAARPFPFPPRTGRS